MPIISFRNEEQRELNFKIKEIMVVLTDQGIIPSPANFYSAKKFYVGCWEWGLEDPNALS